MPDDTVQTPQQDYEVTFKAVVTASTPEEAEDEARRLIQNDSFEALSVQPI